MNTTDKTIIEIENNYFSILKELFGDLITFFENENEYEYVSIPETVNRYCRNKKTFLIKGYKDSLSYKREQLYKNVASFWDKNKDTLVDYIKGKPNVGIFGARDDTLTYEYLDEIKRNSIFYDILVFNDPFYTSPSSRLELNLKSNEIIFYENILTIWEMKPYTSVSENEVFLLIFPFDSLFSNELTKKIFEESEEAGILWVNEMFGIDVKTRNIDNVFKNVEILQDKSLKDIQTELYKNGIIQSIADALNYSQSMWSDQIKIEIEKLCFDRFGEFNRDFAKCFLLMEALPALAILNNYIYKSHTITSNILNSLPIMSQREWAPLHRDLKNNPLRVSEDYMFTCAVHKNDKMSALMSLDYEEIVQYHNRDNCYEFRSFFHKATEEIVNSHENFDEIANEVFFKVDALLEDEYQKAIQDKKYKMKNSIIGIFKALLSFIPFLSYAISGGDIFASSFTFAKALMEKPTLIKHIYTRNKK